VYTLFARPGAFTRYILASPTLYVGNGLFFDLEADYAAENDDLPVHLFFGAGTEEASEYIIAAHGCLSSTVRMVEMLSLRGYPSLRMKMQIFQGESHATIIHPVLRWGVASVWGDEV
jgi:predicted alpha/beta superfamily hydrolase